MFNKSSKNVTFSSFIRFGRTTIFVAVPSGTVVALALLAQASNFRRETLWFALALSIAIGAGLSLVFGVLHIRYAAAFRRSHDPSQAMT
jgi:hypothetical protein